MTDALSRHASTRLALSTAPRGAVLIAALSLTTAWFVGHPAHAAEVLTDTSRVHRCVPVKNAETGATAVFATTDGGLIKATRRGQLESVWTALDGLAGTRSHALWREGNTLWIGGEDGLTRAALDGTRLRIETTYESASNAPVRAVIRHAGALYAGTWGAGVQRLHDGSLQPVPGASQQPASSRRITAFAIHRGQLIAATAGRGLYRLEGDKLKPMAVPGLQRAMVWSLLVHRERLLVGAVSGLFAVTDPTARPDQLATGDIRQLSRAGEQLVAATFGQGLIRVTEQGAQPLPGTPDGAPFTYGYASSGGAACIAGHTGLWLRADNGPWRAAQHGGLPSGDIAALAVEEAGPNNARRVWIGTFDSGLAVYDNGRIQSFAHPRIDRKVNALAVTDGKIWVGTSAGLSIVTLAAGGQLDGATVTRIARRDGLPSSFIMALRPLRGGGMLVGTAHGAVTIRGDSIQVIGRKRGIYISNVWSVNQDADGSLLLGTTKGLYRVRDDGAWERFSVASGHLVDDWVMAIERIGDTWWVGTYKGGVSKLSPIVAHSDGPQSDGPRADGTRRDGSSDGRSDGQSGGDSKTGTATPAGTMSATQLGGGFINPSGLLWHDGALYAATMDGVLAGDGDSWQPVQRTGTGRDTTVFAAVPDGVGAGLWIATRRGIRIR